MAKDPAFLFYPGDWQGGTMYLTHEQKGCYMDLLILQFNVGKFTIEQAKQVLSICFSVAWPMLQQKFIKEGDFYYNEKLRAEIEKRKKFTESRRNNGLVVKKGKDKKGASAKHMHKHMENENENENKDEKGNKIEVVFPWQDLKFLQAWKNWKVYKSGEHKFKYKTLISEQSALKELCNLSNGHVDNAIKIIEKSISKGWKGFFKLQNDDNETITIKTAAERESEIDDAINRHFGG